MALLAYWVGLCHASAFYDPGAQRWLNRDPLGESGFEVLRSGRVDLLGDGPNLYTFVKNNSANQIDAFGLDGEATLGADPTLLMDADELAAYKCKCVAYAAAVQAAKKVVGAVTGQLKTSQSGSNQNQPL